MKKTLILVLLAAFLGSQTANATVLTYQEQAALIISLEKEVSTLKAQLKAFTSKETKSKSCLKAEKKLTKKLEEKEKIDDSFAVKIARSKLSKEYAATDKTAYLEKEYEKKRLELELKLVPLEKSVKSKCK